MKKEYYLYPLFFVVSAAINYMNAVAIPPIWAGYDCFYNSAKNFAIFPGSLIVSLITLFLIYKLSKRGMPYFKSFLISLLTVTLLFSVINILILILDSNFQLFESYYQEKLLPKFLPR